MPNRDKEDGRCNARVKQIPEDWDVDEAYCANKAGFRTDHVGDGRCYLHGGCSVSANQGNTYNEKHGLYTQRSTYYEKRSDEERNWIDGVVESILDDIPGGDTDPSYYKLKMIRNIAIDMHKVERANDYIDEIGVVHKDKTIGYTDDGRPLKEDQENPLNIAYDRLSRDITRRLEKLGALDSPDAQQADAQQNIANELSALRAAREGDGA